MISSKKFLRSPLHREKNHLALITSLSKDNLVKNKILVNSSDLLKIIEKEYQLTQEMNNHIKIIAEIDAQMKTNSQLLALYKSPIRK